MISLSILIDFESPNSRVLADTVSEHDTTEEGGRDHVIATIHWHSKIKKYGYKVNKRLYGQGSNGGAMGVQGFWQNWTCLVVK